MIKMPVPWFDIPENSPGNLASLLAVDSNKVKNLTSDSVALVIQSVSCLVCGIVIAFFYTWELTLVIFATVPLLLIAGVV